MICKKTSQIVHDHHAMSQYSVSEKYKAMNQAPLSLSHQHSIDINIAKAFEFVSNLFIFMFDAQDYYQQMLQIFTTSD